jgi:hypothetical protein
MAIEGGQRERRLRTQPTGEETVMEQPFDGVTGRVAGLLGDDVLGVDPAELTNDDLLRELASVHETRHETLRHGSESALMHHNRRMAELEGEYLRRYPQREVDANRLRDGSESA